MVVGGLVTTYQQVGQGPVVLLLHGWGDDSNTFSGLASQLANKYQLVEPDLPGFGQTAPPPNVWSLTDYAQFVKEFLNKLNLGSIYAVVGHSNGGALAIHALATGAISADNMVLISASGIRDRQKARRFVLKLIAKTGKAATFFLPLHMKQELRKKLYGAAGSDLFVAPHIQETFKKTVRQDVQTDASQLSQPTLLIYGSNDKATPPLYGKIYSHLIKGSRLEVIPDAEHFVHQEKTDKVAELITEFLS